MIRRIVDSVSLLIDTESQHNQDCSRDSPTNPEFDSTDYNFFGSHAAQLSVDSNTKSNGISCSSPFLSHCSSIPSSPVTLSPNEPVIDCGLFGSYSQTGILSNAISCYVAPKEKAERNFPPSSLLQAQHNLLHHSVSDEDHLERHSSSSPSPVRHRVRRQSLSPKCSVNLNSFKRQLPGGPVLQPQRPQPQNRVHRPHLTQVSSAFVRKKETTEQFDRLHPKPTVEQIATPSAVDDESDLKDVGVEGTASQADPLIMSVECLLLPFIRSLTELAAENELLILSASSVVVLKGLFEQPTIVVRKRAALIQRQQTELECRQREAEAHAQRLAAEKAEERLKALCEIEGNQTLPTHRDTCCQASVEDSKPETGLGRKKYRRLRNERRRQAKAALTQASKRTKLVDSCIQTVPEDHLLCSWCLQHIPPEAQCGHEAICRAGVKQKEKERELKIRLAQRKADVETRRRQRLGLQPLIKAKRKPQGTPAAVVSIDSISGRSRSHTRLAIREKLKKKSVSV
ncbi:hypothetical protein AHF37_06105 [Paragonimus kellicotti]|nr:hypothetical protein AHF37_06105 [Paragonimus kellicotti]